MSTNEKLKSIKYARFVVHYNKLAQLTFRKVLCLFEEADLTVHASGD
jgi:hypothetical protein